MAEQPKIALENVAFPLASPPETWAPAAAEVVVHEACLSALVLPDCGSGKALGAKKRRMRWAGAALVGDCIAGFLVHGAGQAGWPLAVGGKTGTFYEMVCCCSRPCKGCT